MWSRGLIENFAKKSNPPVRRNAAGAALAVALSFCALPVGFWLETMLSPMPPVASAIVAVLLFGPAYLFLYLTFFLLWKGRRGAAVAALIGIALRIFGLMATAFFFFFVLHDFYQQALYLYLVYAVSFLFFEIASLVVFGFMAADLWRRKSPSSVGPE